MLFKYIISLYILYIERELSNFALSPRDDSLNTERWMPDSPSLSGRGWEPTAQSASSRSSDHRKSAMQSWHI